MTTAYTVVGIDASLTATGLATLTPTSADTQIVRTAGKRSDSIAVREDRIAGIGRKTHAWTGRKADLYVIEGPSLNSRGGSPWDRAGVWWRIVAGLPTDRVAIVPPRSRAKWATDNGNADKAAVAVVAARLCPDANLTSSDVADAVILALMGAHALGHRPDLDTKYRAASLLKAEWPADVTARLLAPYEAAA